MKLIKFSLFTILALICFFKVNANDDEEEIIEEELEQEILDEVVNESAEVPEHVAKEQATGIVEPINYPGRIVSRKKVISKVPAAGQPLEFEYTIWNVGNSDVSDIELIDDSFNSDDFESSVNVNIKKDLIKPGQSYSEVHTVVPKMNDEAQIKLQNARVTYKTRASNENSELLQRAADSAHDGIVPIATAAFYARNVASHCVDWLIFLALAFPFTLLQYNQGNALVAKYYKVKSA